MKKLNTIFSLVLLSFCLLINVSFAIEFTSECIPQATVTKIAEIDRNTLPKLVIAGDYTLGQGFELWDGVTGNNDTLIAYNSFLQACTDKGYTVFGGAQGSSKTLIVIDGNCDVGSPSLSDYFSYAVSQGQNIYFIDRNGYYKVPQVTQYQATSDGYVRLSLSSYSPVGYLSSNKHFKTITIANTTAVWDGVYLSEQPPIYLPNGGASSEPETPTMPTNAEIASAVQMFYNSVYNLPNIAFDDFVVLYDNTTGLYTYIGHTLENALGQVIVEPNGYYEGYKYNVQWWKFFIDDTKDNWLDKYSNYYVYTSDGTIDNLKYVGYSNISGLIEKSGPWATSNTVIVYSTNDYPVKYVTFSEDSPDPDIQTGTIQGDQYTYDENLDITDNLYNPLDNFISINYPSTLVGNADFDSFLNTFNENKDVLILPQNANWVILANNSLFSHFSSFIIMCTLFIILQRVMRG